MRFVLLMPEFDEGHFTIDMGIIPQRLSKDYGWDVIIAAENGVAVPDGVRSIAFGCGRLQSLRFLWREAPHIDVLELMHFTWRTVVRCLVFHFRNRWGTCYVKLDLAEPQMRELEAQVRRTGWRLMYGMGVRVVDVFSVESTGMRARFAKWLAINKFGPSPQLLLVPSCGFDDEEVLARFDRDAQVGTGPDLLYVGRLGPWQKAPEVLLDAFRVLVEDLAIPARLMLVGRQDERFEALFARWREQVKPSTAIRVAINSPIRDHRALMDLYLQSRVFVLSSRYEGVPNVLVEAACCGCFLVTTPVGQAEDVLRAGAEGWALPATMG